MIPTPSVAHLSHYHFTKWMDGDESAFTDLFQLHWGLVLAVCRRQLPADEAEDAAQTVFLILLRKPDAACAALSIEGWLLAVTRRVVANAQRGRISRIRAEYRVSSSTKNTQNMSDKRDSETLYLLDPCLAELSDKERSAISMYYLSGRTHEEIARDLECPKGTVYSLISRGLHNLRNKLKRRGAAIILKK